jgi:diguanylate cyclase (GGDEF)-like protein/PAS domain S-box-containing protein
MGDMGESNSGIPFFKTLMENIFDGVLQVNTHGHIIAWNKGAERITGLNAGKTLGQDFREIFPKNPAGSNDQLRENAAMILKTLEDGIQREGLISYKHKEGYFIKLLVRTTAIHDITGRIIGVFEIINDNKGLMSIYQQNRRTEETVLFDTLTGIGNRAHIESRIRQTLEYIRGSGEFAGIMFMDIDHFKDFNDTYGHLLGDKVLRYVANSLRHHLRTTDSCGRWGGEEFLALIRETNSEGLSIAAEKLRALVSQTAIEENGQKLHVTISIGATRIREDDSLESLLKRADDLMYQSKSKGRNCVTMDE